VSKNEHLSAHMSFSRGLLSIGVASAFLLCAHFGHVLLRIPKADPNSTKQKGSLLPQEELHGMIFFPGLSVH